MTNSEKYTLGFKLRFVSFMFFYGCVKYLPTPIGDLLRTLILKLYVRKILSWHIKDGVTFWYPEGISIGRHVSINEFCFLDGYGRITIGDYTRIANHCSLISEDHGFQDIEIPICQQKRIAKSIIIGKNVWIGSGTRILKGVTIGEGSVIGAGSVVTRDIPPNVVAFGVPARVIKYRKNTS